MMAVRASVCMLVAIAAYAQNEDVFGRLRTAITPAARAEAAVTALKQKNYAQVEHALTTEVPTTATESYELLALEGAVHFLDGNFKLAAESFRAAGKVAPLKETDSFTCAMALIKEGEGTESRGLLTGLATSHPDRAIYIYWLGKLDYDQRRYVEALAELKRATNLDPQSSRTWDSLGLTFDMQGQNDKALEAFKKAATLNRSQPKPSPWPPHNLGYLLLRMNQSQAAENALHEALQYDPQMFQAHYHLGRVFEQKGRDADAVKEYKTAVSLDQSSTEACYSLATLYRKLKQETEASAMFAEYRKRKAAATSNH